MEEELLGKLKTPHCLAWGKRKKSHIECREKVHVTTVFQYFHWRERRISFDKGWVDFLMFLNVSSSSPTPAIKNTLLMEAETEGSGH